MSTSGLTVTVDGHAFTFPPNNPVSESPTHVSSTSSAALSVASPLSESGRSSGSQASPTTSQQSPPGVTQSVSDHETHTSPTNSAASGPVSTLPTDSPRQSPASTSLPITSGTSSAAPTPTSSAQASVSVRPQQNPVAGTHRNVLTKGAIGGISVVIVAVVLAIILVIRLRRRRRDRRDTNVKARMLSPFVHLMSGTPVGGPEITADSPGARLQYLEKEIRKTRGRIVEIDARTRVEEQPVETSTLAANAATEESSSNGPRTTEPDGEVALRARISELEAQMRGAWALGLSDDPPPGYTA